MTDRRKLLVFASLFPSAARPRHGIFVETRLHQLLQRADFDVRVIAPVPWFPSGAGVFGNYAQWARTPAVEDRRGLPVWHPRYLMMPKVGMRMQPTSIVRATQPLLNRFEADGWVPDLIDAHYFFPDGVAATQLGARGGIPVVVTARGSDINLIAQLDGPRREIVGAAARAAAVVAVSDALRDRCIAIGIEPAKISVLRNGVDLTLFVQRERNEAKAALQLDPSSRWLAVVGNLVAEKGIELAISALVHLPQTRLLVIGEGRERDSLQALAAQLGVSNRIDWRAPMPQDDLVNVYSACDALLLTSLREGWPNVVLEALACGTPVVATDVGPVRQLLTSPSIGAVLDQRDPARAADAIERTLAQSDRQLCRSQAQQYGWTPVVDKLVQLFGDVIEANRQRQRCAA